MFPDDTHYGIDGSTTYPQGTYPEGKFKVEDITVEGSKTIIKLVKTPDYDYRVVVNTLQGQPTTGNPAGHNLKVVC